MPFRIAPRTPTEHSYGARHVSQNATVYHRLSERIHDLNSIDLAGVLKIFGQQNAAAGLLGRPQNQRIPKRKPVQPVEIDGSEDIGDFRSGYIEFSEQFNLATHITRIKFQLLRDGYKILL